MFSSLDFSNKGHGDILFPSSEQTPEIISSMQYFMCTKFKHEHFAVMLYHWISFMAGPAGLHKIYLKYAITGSDVMSIFYKWNKEQPNLPYLSF